MKGNSTKSKGPRHLDARTSEGRAYRKKVGNAAFAKARRNAKKPAANYGPRFRAEHGKATPQVNGQVKSEAFSLRETNAIGNMTTPQLADEIKRQEARLAVLRNLHRMRASMDRALGIILDGGTAAEASAALELPATPAKN